MTVKVVTVDLAQPFPDLSHLDLTYYTHLQILVRHQEQSIGYAWVHIRSRRFVAEDHLRHVIEEQLFDSLNRAAFDRALQSGVSPMSDLPAVTVAVCTRGRAKSLQRTLRSLLKLDYPADKLDLLVVDNAPTDNETRRVVTAMERIRYVVEPRPGLDWARNRAVQEAHSAIIAFTDDDVVVDPFWVRAAAGHFEHTAVMCVTGLVVPAERETPMQNVFEEYSGFGRGFERRYYNMSVQKHWRYWPLGAGIFGTGCNMVFRKVLFAEIGSFDTALDVGTPSHGAGDHDMFYRTLRSGYTLVYEPDAIVWHYHRRSYAELRRQLKDFGYGVYAFWMKTFWADRQMRWRTLRFALIWYWKWFLVRLWRPGRLPRKLVAVEALGALLGPLAYWQARRQAARITAQSYTE